MGRKQSKRALEEGQDGSQPKTEPKSPADGMTDLERERAAIIARNRERLLALGIPSLIKELEGAAAAAADGGGKPAKKKQKKAAGAARAKKAKGAAAPEEHPTRRSTRIQEAEQHPNPKEETAEERFERELGEFVVEGECPRCGRLMERGHKAHLQACTGAEPARQSRPRQVEDLEELTEEERRDQVKRTLARMKKLHLDGLVELTPEAAKFAVLGSTNNHYTVSLKDDKHTCQCLDYRFRRHHCKHICLVLSNLGILDKPAGWRAAVEARMDELVGQMKETQRREAQAVAAMPRDKKAEVAMKFT